MALLPAEPGDADWLVAAARTDPRLISVGPRRYDAYARLRFIPDPARPGQEEGDVDLPEDGRAEIDQIARVLTCLAGFTTTPTDCRFAVWTGWPTAAVQDLALAGRSTVGLPDRDCVLLAGAGTDVKSDFVEYRPAFVWPADRGWCLTSDVDPHWAAIGASVPAIDALLALPDLDVVPMDPDRRPPTYH